MTIFLFSLCVILLIYTIILTANNYSLKYKLDVALESRDQQRSLTWKYKEERDYAINELGRVSLAATEESRW